MKLILRHYLEGLKEREELDAILPDLLSRMGLNVISHPQRGTRQHGVDIAAVGYLDGSERVYLFSIKAGNLSRQDWNGPTNQALRPSLDEIRDRYVPGSIPSEHRRKPIVICICVGGMIREEVAADLRGYIDKAKTAELSFEEWNGDFLAGLLSQHLLGAELLPDAGRSDLRKALALVEEPDACYRHFRDLLRKLVSPEGSLNLKLSQLAVCTGVLFAWGKDANNLDGAYRGSELALLLAWDVLRREPKFENPRALTSAREAFKRLFNVYRAIGREYIEENVTSLVNVLHGISHAASGPSPVDVNIRLFDVLGRFAIDCLWAEHNGEGGHEVRAEQLRALVDNNPGLNSPIRDDFATDIGLALLVLSSSEGGAAFAHAWSTEIFRRAVSAIPNLPYPCILHRYKDLALHPPNATRDYFEHATAASVLYPTLALANLVLGNSDVFQMATAAKERCFTHCTFQLWYPDEASEDNLYSDADKHGATLINPLMADSMAFLAEVLGECDHTPAYMNLSAVKESWNPIVLVACRHYRLPVPPHLFREVALKNGTWPLKAAGP